MSAFLTSSYRSGSRQAQAASMFCSPASRPSVFELLAEAGLGGTLGPAVTRLAGAVLGAGQQREAGHHILALLATGGLQLHCLAKHKV